MKLIKTLMITLLTLCLIKSIATAHETSLDLSLQQNIQANTLDKLNSDFEYKFQKAVDKFKQGNIRSSHEDFEKLTDNYNQNDYNLILLAEKTAEFGLYDLTTYALDSVRDKKLISIYRDDIKRFYYPHIRFKPNDNIILGEAFSNIMYNDLMLETVEDLKKNQNLINHYDYANYLIALAYYKTNNIPTAQKYILIARLQNPTNLNYKCLHAEIMSKGNQPNVGIKIITEVKKENLKIAHLKQKINAEEQLILYNASKLQAEKDYHLGYYYYLENEIPKSLRILQNIQTKKKGLNSEIYALISKMYYETSDYEKSELNARKSLKLNNNQPIALEVLGDLMNRDSKHKAAIKLYKKSYKHDKYSINSQLKSISLYKKLGNSQKSEEILCKLLRTDNVSPELYYEKSKSSPNEAEDYLKKTLSLDIRYKDAWYGLVKISIDKGAYDKAERYLKVAYCIDENDFRYYYYQSLVLSNQGKVKESKDFMVRCKKLNSDFKSEEGNETNEE